MLIVIVQRIALFQGAAKAVTSPIEVEKIHDLVQRYLVNGHQIDKSATDDIQLPKSEQGRTCRAKETAKTGQTFEHEGRSTRAINGQWRKGIRLRILVTGHAR